MIYLSKEELIDRMKEVFIDESSEEDQAIIDRLELAQIAILKSYLGTRLNVDEIFNEDAPIENEVLKDILAKLLLYKLIRRNSARKVPSDLKEQYDEAMKTLKEISTGVIKLDGVPVAVDDTGNVISNSMFGNTTNKDFYI